MKTSQYKSLIFYFFTLLCLFLSISCQEATNHPGSDERNYSTTQKSLFKLLNDYKSEFSSQQSEDHQRKIQHKYLIKLEQLLIDSLRQYIDSMTVTVDTVIQEGWMVTTKFHTREIEFKFGMTFKDSMDSRSDSLYRFMKELKPGQEVTVNFTHLGTQEVNKPNDKNVRTIRIFAYPSPLNF